LDDQDYAAAEKADAAKTAVQAKVLKSNQDLADKGDEYGLLRMGERYRDGDGVPKDLAKAKDYLIKATTAGSPAAADELSKLNSASANSPAAQ
jgi:TPR repeat protein